MRIACPVCATEIRAAEEHIGLKNRCVECGTKFVIPAHPEDEIEVLEYGEDPAAKAEPTKVKIRKVNLPKTSEPEEPKQRKLITKKEGFRGGITVGVSKPRKHGTLDALIGPRKRPGSADETQPDQEKKPEVKLNLAPKATPKATATRASEPKPSLKRKIAKHTLEHLPAIDPPVDETPPDLEPKGGEADSAPPQNEAEAEAEAKTEPLENREETVPEAAPTPVRSPTPTPTPRETEPLEAEPEESERGTSDENTPRGAVSSGFPPAARAQGSFHDLKVKRTQRNARGIGTAIVVLGLCSIMGIVLIGSMGGGNDAQKDELANTNSEEREDLVIEAGPIEGPAKPADTTEKPGTPSDPATRVVTNQWKDVIHPLLDRYCLDCHDEANEEGGLQMERFTSEKLALSEPHIWEKAAAMVKMESMPPRDRFNLPTAEERKQFLAWVASVGERWDAGEFGQNPGRTTIRRLTKNEFNYTIRDLFGIKIRPADNFPEDGGGEDGFDNNADALYLPNLLMENIVEAAGIIVNAVYANQASYTKYLFTFPHSAGGLDAAARKVIGHWAPLIYRRPVEYEEISNLVALVRFQVDKKKKDYRDAMKMPLLAMLISPNFLYRAEKIQPGGRAYKVSDLDLASRLSYFLWSSTPDGELLKLATEKKLSDPRVYEEQVRRMLMDEKARSLGMHFAGQWLKWEELRSRANPDRKRFPQFDFALRVSMYRESSLFFDNLIRENLPLLDLIDSDYSFLNQKLALHYNIPGVTQAAFTKVKLDDPYRGGVIGMGSVLTVTSLPLRSSPAVRGNWLLSELLGTPPPAPPMNVPQLPEDDREIEFTSFRDALTQHRQDPNCKACHVEIDQLGFGLENYDAIGRWREFQNDQPVDSSGTLPDGSKFKNPGDLKKILMSRKDVFARNAVEKALSYALGRDLNPYDRPTVKGITDKLIADGYKTQTLFLEIARSYPFLNCRGDDFQQN